MSILSAASSQSAYRGYEYAQAKKVLHMEQTDDGVIQGTVSGSGGSIYDVIVNVNHPRKSQCNCPHVAGRQIVCKHMVAVFFTAYPEEARQYNQDLEACWAEEEQQQQEQEERLIQYISKMKKSELQQALLQVLAEGPEWLYDCFVQEYLGE